MNRFLKTASEEEEGNDVRKSTLTGAGIGAGWSGLTGAVMGADRNDDKMHIRSLNKANKEITQAHQANPEGDLDAKLRNAQRHPAYNKAQRQAFRNGAIFGGTAGTIPGALVGGAIGYGAGKLSEYQQKEAGVPMLGMLGKQGDLSLAKVANEEEKRDWRNPAIAAGAVAGGAVGAQVGSQIGSKRASKYNPEWAADATKAIDTEEALTKEKYNNNISRDTAEHLEEVKRLKGIDRNQRSEIKGLYEKSNLSEPSNNLGPSLWYQKKVERMKEIYESGLEGHEIENSGKQKIFSEQRKNLTLHPAYVDQLTQARNAGLMRGAKIGGGIGAVGVGAAGLGAKTLYDQSQEKEARESMLGMLGKQAYYELEDPEIQNDPEFLAKTEAYENAKAESDKYPNADKTRTAALGLLVGGGALTGGVLGHKLLGAPAGAFGAMNGAIAGAGLLSTIANPAIERRLEKKHPGRTEAKGKAMSAFDDVMNAEDDFYDRKYGTPGDREAREAMFGKNASGGVGLAMLAKQADELDEWRNSRDELESLKDELNGLKQKDPKAHAARASQVGDHYRQLHQRVYDAPNAKRHYVADVKAGHTNKQASSEREDYETNLRQESKMPETAALLGWGAGAAAGGVLGARFAKRRGIKDSSFAAGGAALGSIPLAYAGRDVGEKMLDHKVNKKSDEEFGKQANEATYVGLRPGMREEALDADSPLIAAYADTNEKGQAYRMANGEASKLHRKNETTRQVGAGAALVGGSIAGGLLPLLASRGKGRVGQFANNHSDALVQGGTLAGGIGSVMTANSALKNRGDKKSEAHNNEVVLPKYEAYRASEDDLYEKLDSEGYETMGVMRKHAGNLEEELREEETSGGREGSSWATGLGIGGGMLAGAAAGERFGLSQGVSNEELLRMKGHNLEEAIKYLPAKVKHNARLANRGRNIGMLGGGALGYAVGSQVDNALNREAEFTDLRNQMLKVANTY